jgi:hypothetical protein
MSDNVELTVRLHPVSGEDVLVMSRDFAGEDEALSAIARAMDERRSLVMSRARYSRETGEHGVVINLANVVSAVVLTRVNSIDATGQYM